MFENRILILQLAEWMGAVAVVMIASTSSRFRPRRVDFMFPLREGLVSFGLFTLVMVFSYFYYDRNSSPISDPISIVTALQQRALMVGVSLLPFAAALYFRRQPLLSVGWGKAMMAMSARLGLVLSFWAFFIQSTIFVIFQGLSPQQIQAFIFIIAICIAEETIFHGFIQLRLSCWIGFRFGWLLTGLFYILWQIPFLLINPFPFWPMAILVTMKGLLLGWIANKGGHLLAPTAFRAVSDWIFFLPYIH